MEGLRLLLLAGVIGTLLAGGVYAGVHRERSAAVAESAPAPLVAEPDRAEPVLLEPAPPEPPPFDPVLTVAVDLDEQTALFPTPEDIVLANGVRLGPLGVGVELDWEAEAAADEAAEAAEEAAERSQRRRTRRAPPRPPIPRLHPDPGMHSILVARRMMASRELIQGSCYRYLSEVYTRAGHRSWRNRRIVYRAERDGPYADLDQIRPGDWLYIVNDPGRTPVGTHSVMFVRWQDRARGWASVISHPGWGAPSAGREGTYDVSMTYRIIRPTL